MKTVAQEAGLSDNWKPIETEPVIPGQTGAPPAPNAMGNYFQGSLSPSLQHDAVFVGTEYGTPRIPGIPLMPIAPSGNPLTNSAIKSGSVTVVTQAAASKSTSGLNFRGTWQNFTNYNVNDVVLFNISAYVALNSSTNSEPDINPNSWTLLGKNLNFRGQWQQFGATQTSHISFVQAQAVATGGSTAVVTFASPNTAGNTILVMAGGDFSFSFGPVDPNYALTVMDTQGNTYIPVASHLYSGAAGGTNLINDSRLFIATNVKGGPNTVTVTALGGGANPVRITYNKSLEYSGNTGVNPLVFSSNTVAQQNPTVSLSTTQINQMAVLFEMIGSGSSSAPAGFNGRGNGGFFGTWDKIIASPSTATYTVSDTPIGLSLWGVVLTDIPQVFGYVPFDTVEYLGSTYVCIQSTNINPVIAGASYWIQLSQGTGGINNLTASYPVVTGDYGKLLTNTTSSAFTVTLPSTPPLAAWWIALQNSGSGTIVINPNGLTLDGSGSNLTLIANQGILIFTDGTNYFTERGMGGVTSVGLSLPNIFIVSGSPVTSSGTLTAVLANEPANTFLAGPVSGAAAAPTFRTLVVNDFNGGLAASSSTFWRGDGTWSAVPAEAFPIVVATVSSTNNTVTQTGNLLVSGGVPPAGVYRITVYMVVTSSSGAAGNLDAQVAWNDGVAARTASNGSNGMPADISTAATNFAQGSVVVKANGSNNISYTITKS